MGSGDNNWPLAAFFLVGMVGVSFAVKHFRDTNDFGRFEPKLKAWGAEPATAAPDTAYVRGKVLPLLHTWRTTRVRGRYPAVDEAFYRELPDDLRAGMPDDVGTVVWLDWTEENRTVRVDYFTARVTACIEHCTVTLIDTRANKKLASKLFKGKDPDKVAPGEPPVDRYRPEPPYKAIIAYLQGLPRKD